MTPEICPLCEMFIGPEEESKEIWFSTPSARQIMLYGTAQTDERIAGAKERTTGDYFVLGRPLGQTAAILDALESEERVDVRTQTHVEEIRSVGMESKGLMETATSEGKVGAKVSINPPDPPSPDSIMHQECFDSVFGGPEDDS